MAKVTLKTGNEGPKHDPYRYEEWRVEKNGKVIIGHFGLVIWVEQNGCRWSCQDYNNRFLYETFQRLTGVTLQVLEKAYQRMRSTCICGCREQRYENGFPGEELAICVACGKVVFCEFDESAVM